MNLLRSAPLLPYGIRHPHQAGARAFQGCFPGTCQPAKTSKKRLSCFLLFYQTCGHQANGELAWVIYTCLDECIHPSSIAKEAQVARSGPAVGLLFRAAASHGRKGRRQISAAQRVKQRIELSGFANAKWTFAYVPSCIR